LSDLFLKGLIVGFCIAAPVGPIAALIIHRTTSEGKVVGLVSGLGAAVADALYGAVAAFGVTVISEFLMAHREMFLRGGGVVLCILGIRLLLAKPGEEKKDKNGLGLVQDFVSTLLLTFTNPMTLVAFTAVFATLGVGAVRGHSVLTAELVAGVLAGSMAWWAILVAIASLFKSRWGRSTLLWINRGIGIFVIGVGVVYMFVVNPKSEPPAGVLMRKIQGAMPAEHP